jgi:hypothetical protein
MVYARGIKADQLAADISTDRNAREPELRDRLRKYGLSVPDYRALLLEAAGKCAGCGEPCDDFVVDHCHRTGKVRGLVHAGCNSTLGFAADSPERLRALADYLERHQATTKES